MLSDASDHYHAAYPALDKENATRMIKGAEAKNRLPVLEDAMKKTNSDHGILARTMDQNHSDAALVVEEAADLRPAVAPLI